MGVGNAFHKGNARSGEGEEWEEGARIARTSPFLGYKISKDFATCGDGADLFR